MSEAARVPVTSETPSQPAMSDPWEKRKQVIYQLYLVERKPLVDVKKILETNHGFIASTNMYKKKIRQWKFQTRRKGWDARSGLRKMAPRTSAFRPMTCLHSPTELREQELSVHSICNSLRQRLYSRLSSGYVPINTLPAEPVNVLRPYDSISDPGYTTHWTSLDSGLILMGSGGKASTVGALLERSFSQIELLAKTSREAQYTYPMESSLLAYTRAQPGIARLILTQFHRMSVKLYGRNHALSLQTAVLLKSKDLSATIDMFLTAILDTWEEVLGRYETNAFNVRGTVLANKAHIPDPFYRPSIEEWEQMIHDSQIICKDNEYTRVHKFMHYVYTLLEIMKDYPRVEKVVGHIPAHLDGLTRQSGKEEAVIRQYVRLVQIYAKALAHQNKNAEADAAFRLALRKGTELLGEQNQTVLHTKNDFATFLASIRGGRRKKEEKEEEEGKGVVEGHNPVDEELTKLEEEIEVELKDFMLEAKGMEPEPETEEAAANLLGEGAEDLEVDDL